MRTMDGQHKQKISFVYVMALQRFFHIAGNELQEHNFEKCIE